MLEVDSKIYENTLQKVVSSSDLRSLVKEFARDTMFFFSIVSDLAQGRNSPNHKIVEEFCKHKGINDSFVEDQARLLLEYIAPETPDTNYYDLLGVSVSSSVEEIRAKWIELLKENHPDRAGLEGLARTKELNEAYSVLISPGKRAEYDSKLFAFQEVSISAPPVRGIPLSRFSLAGLAVILVMTVVFFILQYLRDIKGDIYQDSALTLSEHSLQKLREVRVAAEPTEILANRETQKSPEIQAFQEPQKEQSEAEVPSEVPSEMSRKISSKMPSENSREISSENSPENSSEAAAPELSLSSSSPQAHLEDGDIDPVIEDAAVKVLSSETDTAPKELPKETEQEADVIVEAAFTPITQGDAVMSNKPIQLTEQHTSGNVPEVATRVETQVMPDEKSGVFSETEKRVVPAASVEVVTDEESRILADYSKGLKPPAQQSVYIFVSDYVSAYKNREWERFISFFDSEAKENGLYLSEGITDYQKNFRTLEILTYEVVVNDVAQGPLKATVEADFVMTFKHKGYRDITRSSGKIHWELKRNNHDWKIEELDYVVNDSKAIDWGH